MIGKQTEKIKYIAKIGILSAIAAVIMAFDFPLWFAPSFYQLDFSDVIAFIGSFALGPIAGVLIELLKNLLKVLIFGTSTAYVGDFANFVTGCALILPAAWIYKTQKTRKSAIIGMLCGTLSFATIGALMNYFVLVPAFSEIYNMPMETIIGMGTKINSKITDLRMLILLAVVPFNLFKGIADGLITFILYKRLAILLKK